MNAMKLSTALLISLILILTGCNPGGAIQTSQPANVEPGITVASTQDPASETTERGTPSITAAQTQAPQTADRPEIPTRQSDLPDENFIWDQLLRPDDILPIYDPEFVGADQAPYDNDELVIGLEINGEAKAYSIGVLNGREMVNDTVGGTPVLVTW
jgi:hypothetical protein